MIPSVIHVLFNVTADWCFYVCKMFYRYELLYVYNILKAIITVI